MAKAIVLFSGGLDSTALISFLKKQDIEVHALHISYGQAAEMMELKTVKIIAAHYDIPLKTIKVRSSKKLSVGDIRGRNAFLIFSALTLGPKDTNLIAIGLHAGTLYYDCSEVFFNKISSIVEDYSGGKTKLIAPFLDWSKADIYQYCKQNKIPVHLTYSCETGQVPPCGTCLSCGDRRGLNVS